MPFDLIVGLLVKALQIAPKIIEAISSSKELSKEEKEALLKRIVEAKASVPEWK